MKVEISEDSYQFLKSLANEIASQDNRATAQPYFFVVMKPRWHPCHDDYHTGETKVVRIDRTDSSEPDEYEDSDEGFKEFTDSYEKYHDVTISYKLAREKWEALEIVTMEERDEEDNAFLTFKGYEEHVRQNKHNMGKHHSYLKHAYRNPEMASLFKAIAEFKDIV